MRPSHFLSFNNYLDTIYSFHICCY